jgi:3-deoxy-D-manno-octulosonic-acid transferase
LSFLLISQIKYFFALWLYRFAFVILTPIILLLFIVRSRKNYHYRQRLFERLGFLPKQLNDNSIIIHAASVGEVIAIKSFVETLLKQYPQTIITITTFTPTGSAQVSKLFAERVQHCYLPLDNGISSWLFLQQLKPKVMVFMETELWPSLVAQCRQRHIPLLLINARLSAKSCHGYNKVKWLFTPTLQRFSHILSQSQAHQQNFISLGATIENCTVSGNLKYDIKLHNSVSTKALELKSTLAGTRQVWLVASTHLGDDEIVLSAFKAIKQQLPHLLLILVPRHPERFNNVAKLCEQQGFELVRRSENIPVTNRTDIWLLDSLGELVAAYSLADIVTMAGTFSNVGGHNPLEAALFKKPMVLGADMANFTEILAELKQAKAVLQLVSLPMQDELSTKISKQLSGTILDLFNDEQHRQQLGENAYQVMLSNQGASTYSVEKLAQLCTLSD